MSDRYEIRGKLGRGGMSAVYRAYDKVMGREVALKRLLDLDDTNLNEDSAESLTREAAALAQFSHPNVVTIFALEEDEDGPFVAMELIEGQDLHGVVKSGALSWEDFKDIAGQCLEAMVAAGDMGLLHRDIKPANIMLTMTPSERFLVKILDFGLAKFAQQPSAQTLDQAGSFLGSIDYIAPEQLELGLLDQRTDLYSLGCVFYYGLTQNSPFGGGNPAETSMNHINHRVESIEKVRPDLSPQVCAWLMRLIARKADDRPENAREALRQLQEAIKGIDFESVPEVEPEPPVATRTGPVILSPATSPVKQMVQTGPTNTIPPIAGTGPTKSVAAAKTTGPTRSVPGSRKTGANRPSRNATKGAPAKKNSAFLGAMIGGGVAVLLLILFAVMSGGDDPPASDPAGGETAIPPKATGPKVQGSEKRMPALSNEPLPYPEVMPSRADGRPEPPPLPVTNGLVGHFHAGKGTLSRDYRLPANPAERIAFWFNLADETRPLRRDWDDNNGNLLPIARLVTPEQHPGLARAFPAAELTNVSAMARSGPPLVLSNGFTIVGAFVIEMGDSQIFKITPHPWDGTFMHMSTDVAGNINGVLRLEKTKTDRVGLKWFDREPGVIAWVCNLDEKSQRISGIDKTGELLQSDPEPINAPERPVLDRLAIGHRDFDSGYENENGHLFFEFAIYNRPLGEAELTLVMTHLSRQYLKEAR